VALRQALTAVFALATLAATVTAGRAAGSAAPAFAPLQATDTEVSANWAGYVVTAPSTTYTSVTSTWKQPSVTCSATDAGSSSAFWVGLGGYAQSSQALEQVGTSADCDLSGRPSYYAWYELVPAAAVTVKNLKILPGDVVTTSVNVLGGTTIEFQVKDRTRGTTFTTKQPFASPDLTSAEWIAEAPSDCSSFRCRAIALSNFGAVDFSRIAALGNGTGGTLTANPGWTTTGIKLVPDGARGFLPGRDRFTGFSASTAGATPGDATSDGRGFTVQWTADASS